MERTLIAIVGGCASLSGIGQNLVPNPGFELPEDSCSWQCCFNIGSRPLHWYSWTNSPEHFSICAGDAGGNDSLVSVPQNGWSYQQPSTGGSYIGAYAYDGYAAEYREYVGAQLLEPLVPGCAYQLRFRTNPAHGGNYWMYEGGVCDNVGMLLTTTSNAWTGTSGPLFGFRNFAHLRTLTPVEDTLGWTLVEGTIVADSAYMYVVLGNFFTDALTSGYPLGSTSTDIAYYLYDEVEVLPVDADCHGLGLGEMYTTEPVIELLPSSFRVTARERLKATLHDGTGRTCSQIEDLDGVVEMEFPSSPGLYVLLVEARDRTFIRKFVLP
ncbi:MAG TPA: hypothetical protein PKE21_17210 [Flavobacteriales bacterium]|nr:hypothetical protein [Flavobacteriales bacterium]HMR29219.1 hypothetical protein [Flavobacteriales bacterium]